MQTIFLLGCYIASAVGVCAIFLAPPADLWPAFLLSVGVVPIIAHWAQTGQWI